MKLPYLALLSIIPVTLASCIYDSDVRESEPGTKEAVYASFQIVLPTETTSRADFSYSAGSEDEYNVENGLILIYSQDGQLKTSVAFDSSQWTSGSDNYISNSGIVTVALSDEYTYSDGDKVGVILNVSEGLKSIVAPSGAAPSLSNIGAQQLVNFNMGEVKTFTMTSAPSVSGSTTAITITDIPALDKTKIKSNAVETSEPAATVNVQRVAAKVTVHGYTSSSDVQDAKVTINSWSLDITSKTGYVFQKVSATDDWTKVTQNQNRFYANPLASTGHNRIFWAQDPTYDNATEIDAAYISANFDRASLGTNSTFGPTLTSSAENAQYCLENTFNVANMKKGEATRVIFEATYEPTSLSPSTDKSFYRNTVTNRVYSKSSLEAAMQSAAGEGYTVEITTPQDGGYFGFNTSSSSLGISVKKNSASVTDNNELSAVMSNIATGLSLIGDKALAYYKDGKCYYHTMIRHFTDDELGLSNWTMPDEGYGTNNDDKYLGRYGVVRNHWYDITISGVSGIGEPVLPEITNPNDPADSPSSNGVSVSINILAWAKRSQSAEL